MIQLPEVFGLVVCERMEVDAAVKKTSLVGIFQAKRFKLFPTLAQRFTVYAALFGGIGEGTMELTVTQLAMERDILTYKRWFVFPGRDMLVNLEIPIESCVFPSAGRYGIALRFDDEVITRRSLEIYSD